MNGVTVRAVRRMHKTAPVYIVDVYLRPRPTELERRLAEDNYLLIVKAAQAIWGRR